MITLWLVHVWVTLVMVIQRDWLFYAIAVPVVSAVAWACSYGTSSKKDEEDDDELV